MPKYQITGPDGGNYEVEAPNGATEQDVLTQVQAHVAGRADKLKKQNAADKKLYDPAAGESTFENVAAGVGKAAYDAARGLGQVVGLTSREDVAEARKRDEALMDTTAGTVGNVAGQIGLVLAPGGAVKAAGMAAKAAGATEAAGALSKAGGALLAPKTVTAALPAGAAVGAIQPSVSTEETLANTGIGAVANAVLPVATAGVKALAAKPAAAAADKSRNAVRDATFKAAQDEGYVVPPSAVNPSWINKRLESVAGKAAVSQEATVRNQEATNAIIRKELGLAADQPISDTALEALRKGHGKTYAEVAKLSDDAAQALEALKQSRADTTAYFKHYQRSADPAALARAKAAQSDAVFWEKFLEGEAQSAGRPELIPELRAARKAIAQTHDVERALNTSTGNVDATTLGRMVDKGKPLTGGLETAARFADAFPYAREASRVPTPGVSKSEAIFGTLLGAGGAAAGGPAGAAAGVLPLLSGPARSLVLSGPYQRLMARPKYESGVAAKAAEAIDAMARTPGNERLVDLAAHGGSALTRAAAMALVNGQQ